MVSAWPDVGDKMKFLNHNGYDSQLQQARIYFKEGQVLTVENFDLQSSSSSVKFQGYSPWFNSVMFELIDPDALEREEILKVLKDTRAIITEGAMVGFVPETDEDNGWAMRLFRNNASLTAMIRKLESKGNDRS